MQFHVSYNTARYTRWSVSVWYNVLANRIFLLYCNASKYEFYLNALKITLTNYLLCKYLFSQLLVPSHFLSTSSYFCVWGNSATKKVEGFKQN